VVFAAGILVFSIGSELAQQPSFLFKADGAAYCAGDQVEVGIVGFLAAPHADIISHNFHLLVCCTRAKYSR